MAKEEILRDNLIIPIPYSDGVKVRIVGNKQTDTENLCKKIAEIIPLNNSERDRVPSL